MELLTNQNILQRADQYIKSLSEFESPRDFANSHSIKELLAFKSVYFTDQEICEIDLTWIKSHKRHQSIWLTDNGNYFVERVIILYKNNEIIAQGLENVGSKGNTFPDDCPFIVTSRYYEHAGEYLSQLQSSGVKIGEHPELVELADACEYYSWLIDSKRKK